MSAFIFKIDENNNQSYFVRKSNMLFSLRIPEHIILSPVVWTHLERKYHFMRKRINTTFGLVPPCSWWWWWWRHKLLVRSFCYALYTLIRKSNPGESLLYSFHHIFCEPWVAVFSFRSFSCNKFSLFFAQKRNILFFVGKDVAAM